MMTLQSPFDAGSDRQSRQYWFVARAQSSQFVFSAFHANSHVTKLEPCIPCVLAKLNRDTEFLETHFGTPEPTK